jgi:hypothetical protein
MAPSLSNHASFVRPRTGDRDGRPGTRDQGDQNLVIPSRTSSLHSRITQPIPSTLNIKPQQRTPKTLTHAYMVCGVGREPSQWVKAPAPAQGKIGHMKGAVGQFWLPEILGSSPRLEQDNEIARALHAAMRVSNIYNCCRKFGTNRISRLVSLMMLKSALVAVNHIVCTTHSFSSKTRPILYTALPFGFGREQMRSGLKPSGISAKEQNQISMILLTRPTGFHTVCPSSRGILCTICLAITSVACGSTGTRQPTFSTPKKCRAF